MKSKLFVPVGLTFMALLASGCDLSGQSQQVPTQQVALPAQTSNSVQSSQQITPAQQNGTQQTVPAPVSSTTTTQTTPPAAVTAAFGPLEVHFMSDNYHLEGFVWKPAGAGPFPAIVYNHGSEQFPSTVSPQYQYFVDHGYVVILPIRRGHLQSEGPYFADLRQAALPAQRNQVVVDQLSAQVDDVVAGLNYLKTLSYVDPNRIAVAGCSYGGIETVLTSQRDLGLKAAVDFAGASESWDGNPLLRTVLTQAVDATSLPVFFLQAQNDYNTTPSIVLSGEMSRLNKPNEVKIYPPVGVTAAQGHAGFCAGSPNIWGPDVLAFLDKYLK